MSAFRQSVSAILDGTAAPFVLIPATEVANGAENPGRPTLRRGAIGDLVKQIQSKLGLVTQDGVFGPKTEAAVRTFQRFQGLVPDGIVGPKTWAMLGAG
jgi:peptidoglycan hydrolase-like protein with peptidoglycan-binding domain